MPISALPLADGNVALAIADTKSTAAGWIYDPNIGEAARKEGVQIAREMLFAVRERVQGAYLMPPLGRYELALQVLEGLKR